MSGPLLEVHVFVVCRGVSWDGPPGPHATRTLEQVAYNYRTEPPGRFPYEAEFWLFARLVSRRRRPLTVTLRLSLVWRDDPLARQRAWSRPYQTVSFRPGSPVRDVASPAAGVFEGPGRYEFQLWHPVLRKWDQARRRRIVARTFIRIER